MVGGAESTAVTAGQVVGAHHNTARLVAGEEDSRGLCLTHRTRESQLRALLAAHAIAWDCLLRPSGRQRAVQHNSDSAVFSLTSVHLDDWCFFLIVVSLPDWYFGLA